MGILSLPGGAAAVRVHQHEQTLYHAMSVSVSMPVQSCPPPARPPVPPVPVTCDLVDWRTLPLSGRLHACVHVCIMRWAWQHLVHLIMFMGGRVASAPTTACMLAGGRMCSMDVPMQACTSSPYVQQQPMLGDLCHASHIVRASSNGARVEPWVCPSSIHMPNATANPQRTHSKAAVLCRCARRKARGAAVRPLGRPTPCPSPSGAFERRTIEPARHASRPATAYSLLRRRCNSASELFGGSGLSRPD